MDSHTHNAQYVSGSSAEPWRQDSRYWSGSMYNRTDLQSSEDPLSFRDPESLNLYPSHSVSSNTPDPDDASAGLEYPLSNFKPIQVDTRSYTLSDALRPSCSTRRTMPRHHADADYERSAHSSPLSIRSTRSPSEARIPFDHESRSDSSLDYDFETMSEDSVTSQKAILVKQEPEDFMEGLFVLESHTLSTSQAVDTAPHLRFRRPKTPTTEDMRQRMTVFHVNPFASSRASTKFLPIGSKQESLDPAFFTFQLCHNSLKPVDDPEIQFFVTFIDEDEYDEDSENEREDYGAYSWSQSVVVTRQSEFITKQQIPQIGNPFNDFTCLTVHNDDRSLPSGDETSAPDLSSVSRANSPQSNGHVYGGGKDTNTTPSFSTKRPKPGAASNKKPKLHECCLCHKVFPRPSGLSTHMNSHSGEKPFKCPIATCHKHFTVRSNAKRHLRTHRSLSPSDPVFGGPSTSPSKIDISFDEPVITHVHESGPKRLRWARPSMSLRPIGDFVTSRPVSRVRGNGRVEEPVSPRTSEASCTADELEDEEEVVS